MLRVMLKNSIFSHYTEQYYFFPTCFLPTADSAVDDAIVCVDPRTNIEHQVGESFVSPDGCNTW